MRTDLYALLLVLTGCRNLWQTKGAVARQLIGRATAADLTHLAGTSRAEMVIARAYLALYLPGALWTAWYFAVLAIPAAVRLVTLSAAAIAEQGMFSLLGLAGAVTILVEVISMGFIVVGLARTGARIVRQLRSVRRPARGVAMTAAAARTTNPVRSR